MSRTAKVFQNGGSEAVRLPAEFRFGTDEVSIRWGENGDVVLSPKKAEASWERFFALRDQIPPSELEGFMEDHEQGVQERDDPLE